MLIVSTTPLGFQVLILVLMVFLGDLTFSALNSIYFPSD